MIIQDLDLSQRDSENPGWFPEEREGKFWGTTLIIFEIASMFVCLKKFLFYFDLTLASVFKSVTK